MQKNISGQYWSVFAFDETDNTAKTGDAANISGVLRKDGDTTTLDTVNPTELQDGYYEFEITKVESSGNYLNIIPQSATADIQVIGVPGALWTTPPNFPTLRVETDGNLTQVNTLNGHTVQTGDSYSIVSNGDYGNAALSGKMETVLVDTEDMQGNGIKLSTQGKLDVNAEASGALSNIGLQYLAETACPSNDIANAVNDETIVASMLAGNGTIGDYDDTTDSQEAISNSITAGSPQLYTPDSNSVIASGTEAAGTYASTATDDGTPWQITDAGTGIYVIAEFNLGSNRTASELNINGYFDSGAGRIVEIFVWNYTEGVYDKLSAGTLNTEMRNRSSDKDYVFSLSSAHTDPTVSIGEVKVKFQSAQMNNGDDLYLDFVGVNGVSTGGVSPDAIVAAIASSEWGHSLHHIPKFTGDTYYVDKSGGDDLNAGIYPHDAYATIGGAIGGAGAGDKIVVKAGIYTETGLDLNLSGLELHGEIGTILRPATGTALTISEPHCYVEGIEVQPSSGDVGFYLNDTSDYSRIHDCLQSTTGYIGYHVASGSSYIVITRSQACEYVDTGMQIDGKECIVDQVVCRGDGGAETGFKLGHDNAHVNLLNACASIDNATYGYHVVAGADDNLIQMCTTSVGDGGTNGKLDSGTNNAWRGYIPSDTTYADANLVSIRGNENVSYLMRASAGTMASGVVIDDNFVPTVSGWQSDLSDTTDDLYVSRSLIFTSGVLEKKAVTITDYVPTSGEFSTSTTGTAPIAGDEFIIV